MKPKTIAEIYAEVKLTAFRIREVLTLEDWMVGKKYDWIFDGETLKSVAAARIESSGIITTNISATEPRYALLSTKEEIDYLKHLPPFGAFEMVHKNYKEVAKKKSTVHLGVISAQAEYRNHARMMAQGEFD